MAARDPDTVRDEILEAAAVVSAHGLVGAFGHVSGRISDNEVLITRPVPLGQVHGPSDLLSFDVREPQSAPGLPGEVWVHVGIYRARPDVEGICRVQPKSITVLAASGIQLHPVHVLGAMVGEVKTYPGSTLIRSEGAGEDVARALGAADALVLKGNGAVAVGRSVGGAAALAAAWEESAELNLLALSAGEIDAMAPEDVQNLFHLRGEILNRYWRYLSDKYVAPGGPAGVRQKGGTYGSRSS